MKTPKETRTQNSVSMRVYQTHAGFCGFLNTKATHRGVGARNTTWCLKTRRNPKSRTGETMAEAAIVKAVTTEVTTRGGWLVKTTGVTTAGIPDLLGSYRGRALAWEIKQPGNQPTHRQRVHLDMARRAGASAEVVRSRAEARALLDELDAADDRATL